MSAQIAKSTLAFIGRWSKRGQRRVDREERIGPTPETAAKLVRCPLQVMYEVGLIDTETKNAAIELGELYVAIYGPQMVKARGEGGHGHISDKLAWKHANWFLPWEREWSRLRFRELSGVIDLVVHGRPEPASYVVDALKAYARIRRENPLPREIEA